MAAPDLDVSGAANNAADGMSHPHVNNKLACNDQPAFEKSVKEVVQFILRTGQCPYG